MVSIFGDLDKRQRAEASAAQLGDAGFSFEDRADLFNDLLEEDDSVFPLLACPPEVLSGVLLMSDAACAVRMRPLCSSMRGSIDSNAGLWCLLTLRDFAELGGRTKRYRGLRTLADAFDDSRAVLRLEWDPLMICAPPALRYVLLAADEARQRRWNEEGRALGRGWAWFSSKVCRRMANSTFLRWAPLQYDAVAVHSLVGCHPPAVDVRQQEEQQQPEQQPGGQAGMQFRSGRSDSVMLSEAAVNDIYETVQRWHNKAHRDMMREHFQREHDAALGSATSPRHSEAACATFSVTPTLDAVEAAAIAAADAMPPEAPAAAADTGRGAASRRLEEAQLKLALELSRAEADEAAKGPQDRATGGDAAHAAPQAAEGARASGAAATAPPGQQQPAAARGQQQAPEPKGLPLRAEGSKAGAMVFLKEHCLADRVDTLPDALEKSIEHIVHKMAKASTWGLLYESITEELGFRAKSAAHALCAANGHAVRDLLREDVFLNHERMCLPIWRSSGRSMTSLSKLRTAACSEALRQARCGLLRQAALEWCELEDLTEFLDSQLAPLEQAIDNFRAAHEASSKAHTPHVRDIGRLMFRNFCLLDSRVFRPLCLAAYGIVHEIHGAAAPEREEERRGLMEVLEGFHSMLVACDVADDHLSSSKRTKDALVENLVSPISVAVECFSDWDLRGHPSRDSAATGGRPPRGFR